ncbi:MAG: tetratricopeptide repeat protein [Thermoanaerobaculia bacterium]
MLAVPIEDRTERVRELQLEEPETLLSLCGRLRERWETAPASVRDEAVFLYRFIEEPRRAVGLFDERDYFLGETALIAGTACRFLGLRAEARRWFDRAEAAFRHTMNPVAEWSRLSYQRLALRAEEREFEEVFELAPSLTQSFVKLEMPEDALKCRFLEAAALKETEKLTEASETFEQICRDSESLGNRKLQGIARYNLVQIHALLGDADKAILESRKALPLLQEQQNRVGIAKLEWGLAYLLRDQGNLPGAIEMFRKAQQEFGEIGMRADMAAIQLVIADLLLDSGQEIQAEREILAALPVIEELKMVPEGVAAIALLRESLRQRSINRQALRDLHGYFEELA